MQESSHQRLEALFLTGLPTKWVWKKGKGIHKAFKRAWLCLHSYNKDILYILTLGMAEIPYLPFVSVPSKSYSEITKTTAKCLPGISFCPDKRENNL